MRTVRLMPVRLARGPEESQWLSGLRPRRFQWEMYQHVTAALGGGASRVIWLQAPTGSGKTLAAYAAALQGRCAALGLYPTNELLHDQARALQPWLPPERALLRLDSEELDRRAAAGGYSHGEILERLLRHPDIILTNPDLAFWALFGHYGRASGGAALTGQLWGGLASVSLWLLDEFHLYNTKQATETLFLIAHLIKARPHGRVFILASATPNERVRQRAVALGLPLVEVEAGETEETEGEVVAHPLALALVPWPGSGDEVGAFESLASVFTAWQHDFPEARWLIITRGVGTAFRLAESLRRRFGREHVGLVTGLTARAEREEGLRRRITVGTLALRVGIDFKGETEKHFLVFLTDNAPDFVQILGRVARHASRRPEIPFRAVALVPPPVYVRLEKALSEGASLTRRELVAQLERAFRPFEDFDRFRRRFAPAPLAHLSDTLLGTAFQDLRTAWEPSLDRAIRYLTGQTLARGRALLRRLREKIAPLLTFRTSALQGALLDLTSADYPVRTYDLLRLIREGDVEEVTPERFWQEAAARVRGRPEWERCLEQDRRRLRLGEPDAADLLGVAAFFLFRGVRTASCDLWFTLSRQAWEARGEPWGKVVVVEGLQLAGSSPALPVRAVNRWLCRKQMVACIVPGDPWELKRRRALPTLFDLFPLRFREPGGRIRSGYAIALGQDAFFLAAVLGRPDGGSEDEAAGASGG
jgi:CRISPR-associated endonuclease/helicase Cas3